MLYCYCIIAGCPEISSPLKESSVIEGNCVTLECTLVSSPDPKIIWYKGDNPIRDSEHGIQTTFDSESGKAVLKIASASLNDIGKYQCEIENALGKASTKCQLSVKSK